MHKIKIRIFDKKWRASLVLGLLSATLLPVGIAAASSGAIAQSYNTTSTEISAGALVSLSSTTSNEIVPASSTNASTLVGIAASQPLVELSSPSQHNVQVAVGGTIDTLVSDANGPISVGDRITASPVAGIGMKALANGQVVGTAQANLSSVKTVTESFVTTSGKTVQVKVGLLPVAVNVAYYGASNSQGAVAAFVPPFLQSLADTLTGKHVSPLRVLLGTVALLFGFTAVTVMLYIAVKSDIISIGRNPLAEQALRKGLVDVIIAAISVLVISGVVTYAILFD